MRSAQERCHDAAPEPRRKPLRRQRIVQRTQEPEPRLRRRELPGDRQHGEHDDDGGDGVHVASASVTRQVTKEAR